MGTLQRNQLTGLVMGRRAVGTWKLSLLLLLLLATACSRQTEGPRPLDETGPETSNSESRPGSCLAGEVVPEVIRFGVTPYLDAHLLSENFEPVLEYLSKRTGYAFEIVPGKGYASLVNDLEEGRVDVASLSPLTYVQARERMPCLQLMLTQVSFGSVSYSGYLVARADSPVSSVGDLRGKRFAFTAKGSASGYLYPKAFLLERGERAEEYFSKVEFADNHIMALKLLLDGKVDAAATFSSFMRPARGSKLDVGNLRVLAVTGRIPHDAIVARPGLPPGVAGAIQEALAQLNTTSEEGREVLGGALEINGWVRTKNSLYDPVREKLERVMEGTQ
jgi:phosphate/phosphite/phosphonate ABC transporter binding protein